MTYRNFEIRSLAPGVYAAIASPTASAGSNSGIIDLGDVTIVFDTMTTPTAARELRQAAVELTGRVPKYVINSHSHPDHVQGNIAFAEDALLISSTITRREIELRGVASLQDITRDFETQIASFTEELAGTVSPERQTELEQAINMFKSVSSEFPAPTELRAPCITYETGLHFYGTSRTAHLQTFGGAHSPCDAVLWLPDARILFVGDLVIPDGNIIMCLGTPHNWPPILDKLEALGAQTLVPGHGEPMGSEEGFRATRHHLQFMFDLSERARDSGNAPQFVKTVAVPDGESEYWFRKDLHKLIE